MSNFDTNPKKLKDDLLNLIHIREMALPDFQRDFVWQPRQTKELIISLGKEFPAGSLLRIASEAPMFAPRAFATAPELNGQTPKYLVLDGQQRLTSLYQALYGTGDHLYYVNLAYLLETNDIEGAILYERRDRGTERFGTQSAQAQKRILPLSEIFGGDGFYSWLDDIEYELEKDENARKLDRQERSKLREAFEKYVEPIVKYEFPVITLPSNTSLEAVCTIFETLNNTGVRLSVFDLLSARYFAEGENLRQLWADALEQSEYLEDFVIDPYYILQTICSRTKNSIKRSDVLRLKAEETILYWDDAIWGMEQAVSLLNNECGVLKPNWLSYNTVLVPLAAIFMNFRSLNGPRIGGMRAKVKRWYWCSVFGQTYESNPTSQSITDINELKTWIEGGTEPSTVRKFDFNADDLLTTTQKQRAIYRGVMALVVKNGALDFHSTKPITSKLIDNNHIDDHHIFPQSYLRALGTLEQREIDSIVNRTMLDRTTNQIIGNNPPSKYLVEIEQAIGQAGLEKILKSHFIPENIDSSLRRDNYKNFFQERKDKLFELIYKATFEE